MILSVGMLASSTFTKMGLTIFFPIVEFMDIFQVKCVQSSRPSEPGGEAAAQH